VRRARTPRLDFIVIGAQKAGTTSLWRYLEDNEGLRMPPDKEASFFSEPGYRADLRGYLRALFRDAPRGAKLGTVTPVYMHGTPAAPVSLIAERIGEAVPRARLVALLRDPVERARSAHRMMERRGIEHRPFAGAVRELLGAYLERFPREQLHVELSAELARSPADVVARVCEFLRVEPHTPRHVGERFFQSGPPRVSADAERDLKDYLERNAWSNMRRGAQHRESFRQWFELWNVVPEPAAEPVDDRTAALLREHYEEDSRMLEAATGVRVPGDS